ncbi:MAG: hypothetical protein IJ291_03070 [Lachnospiraceae bacterium]|nr:hypothetical protein [Lachnospiraceae bacterium]
MGKKIAFIPIVLMLILMSGCTTEDAESVVCVGSEQVAMEEVTKSEIIIEGVDGEENHYVYDMILSEIVTALQSGPHTVENNEYFTMGICEVAILGEKAEDRVKSISYAFYDINTDGINELIITKTPDAMYPDMRILDIYTIEDGSAVNLVSGYVRNRYYLLDDNTLLNSGSGGAAYSFNELLVFQAGTNKLVSQGLFFSYPKDEDMRECGYYYSEDGIYDVEVATEITAEEYGVFYDEFQSRMVMLELALIES